MLKSIRESFNTKVDAIGLSVFRMFYSLVLLCELLQLYQFRHIIYDKIPFSYVGEINAAYIFQFWFVIIVFLFFGLFTRTTTIVNYLFSVIIFSSADHFEYHVFYAYVGINFLLLFIPISRVFSIDSLIQKLKFTGIGKPFVIDRKVLEINYLVIVFCAIGLVYFDSIFHKLSSKMWVDGLGVWLPSSLPMVVWNDTSFLLNNEFVIKFLGYIVLVFESVFIFLFWFKKCRVPFMILGLFFHIGILIAYPIPWFALTAIAVYLLLMPSTFWLKLSKLLKLKKTKYTFYYDAECPLCAKVVVVIKHLDVFHAVNCHTVQGNYQNDTAIKNIEEEILLINIHGVTANGKVKVGFWAYVYLFKAMLYTYPLGLIISLPGISYLGKKVYNYIAGDRLTIRCTEANCTMPVFTYPTPETQDVLVKGWNKLAFTQLFWKSLIIFLFLGQLLFIWFSPLVQNNIFLKNKLNTAAYIPFNATNDIFTKYFGISYHAVFVDGHFKNYNHIVRVVFVDDNGEEHEIPVINSNGMPTQWNNGIIWKDITFNITSTILEKEKIQNGIVPYLKYFIRDNHLNNSTYNFIFYLKKIDVRWSWQKDFLHNQIKQPWVKVGSCILRDDEAAFVWNKKMFKVLEKENLEKNE